MVKLTKNQRLREAMRAATKHAKQTTLENLPKPHTHSTEPKQKKHITITQIQTCAREDELALKVSFRLEPSKAAFSKVTGDLHFDGEKLATFCMKIPQGSLSGNDFEFARVLEMKGVAAGPHTIRVEIYELWSSGEKLTPASREVGVDYVPVRRQDSWVRVPTVKSVAGADLTVVSEQERSIYREMEENRKRALANRRDEW